MAKASHRPSRLKQQNKTHNKLGHKSKGQVRGQSEGRTSVSSVTQKSITSQSKGERHRHMQFRRLQKITKTMNQKKKLGTASQPPFLVCVVMLSPDMNPRSVMAALTGADETAIVTQSKSGNTHISCTLYKQRYTFVVPPIDDLYAILDTVKVCTTLMMVWPCCDSREDLLEDDQDRIISCIMAQGLPATVHVTMGYQDMADKAEEPTMGEQSTSTAESLVTALTRSLSLAHTTTHSSLHSPSPHSKRKKVALDRLLSVINETFPAKEKIHQLDKPMEARNCLRQVFDQSQKSLFFRDHRAHMLADEYILQDDVESPSTGTLLVSGYMRGVPLSVNSLVHVPGWGDYQLGKVVCHTVDPHPLVLNKNAKKREDIVDNYEFTPDEALQQTTTATREVDSDTESDHSDTCDDDEDLDVSDGDSDVTKSVKSLTAIPVKKAKIPGANSEYMATWMIDNDAYDADSDDYDEAEEDDGTWQTPAPAADQQSECADDDDDEEDDNMSIASGSEFGVMDEAYDEKIDYGDEMGEYERINAYRDDLEFPDEMDTPRDISARERFHKYRGLESFKTSPWDLSQDLPQDYKKIFHIPKYNQFRKKVLSAMEEETEGAVPGQYVTLHIKNVEKHLYQDHIKSRSPLVLFSLLMHEQKMALVNMVIKSHSDGHTKPIQSKDRLIFHVGFRRFANKPIFSDHTAGDKQKFCRFFHPGETVVASVYAPVTYCPASVLVFKQFSGGRQELLATGSVYTVNANRCILKRIILSGHPFKIHKRSAVIRYMFFDRNDIVWFKSIELKTKWGRKGKIKEPLGTHGHMKCQFNKQLKSQDTIMLLLYKRVYPKWTYDPCVNRPCLMYKTGLFASNKDKENEDDEAIKKSRETRDKLLMPPPSKKRRVHFC